LTGFSKAVQAANYYFWMLNLEPEITENDDNRDVGPAKGCTSLQFEKVKFSYPLAPNIKVLKGVSLDVSVSAMYQRVPMLMTVCRFDPESLLLLLAHQVVAKAP
jgi:ABC-type multidrug transport system fused ATPase/permease subunit